MKKNEKNIIFLIILFLYNIIAQYKLRELGFLYSGIINPLFWLFCIILTNLLLQDKQIKRRKEELIIRYFFIAALIYIIIYLISGLILTYGRNPYSNTVKGFILNIWIIGISLVSKEVIRFKIMANNKKKDLFLVTVIIFTLMDIDLFIPETITAAIIFKIIAETVIPSIIKNVLYSTIAEEISYKPAVIYEMTIQLMYWVSPILPNAPWILNTILNIIFPLILFVYSKNEVIANRNLFERKRNKENQTDPKRIVLLGVISVPLVCFVVGIFPISPRAIATASMYPEIAIGDVVIIKKCSCNDLKIGDVIEYQIEDQFIIHRIVEMNVENGQYVLITKGDNNKSNDAHPVEESQVIGKIIYKVKYLGIPSIKLNQLMNSDKEIYVETGN